MSIEFIIGTPSEHTPDEVIGKPPRERQLSSLKRRSMTSVAAGLLAPLLISPTTKNNELPTALIPRAASIEVGQSVATNGYIPQADLACGYVRTPEKLGYRRGNGDSRKLAVSYTSSLHPYAVELVNPNDDNIIVFDEWLDGKWVRGLRLAVSAFANSVSLSGADIVTGDDVRHRTINLSYGGPEQDGAIGMARYGLNLDLSGVLVLAVSCNEAVTDADMAVLVGH